MKKKVIRYFVDCCVLLCVIVVIVGAVSGFKPIDVLGDYVIQLRSDTRFICLHNAAGTPVRTFDASGRIYYQLPSSVCPYDASTPPGATWLTATTGNSATNAFISDGAGGQEAARDSCLYTFSEAHWCPPTVTP